MSSAALVAGYRQRQGARRVRCALTSETECESGPLGLAVCALSSDLEGLCGGGRVRTPTVPPRATASDGATARHARTRDVVD
eukprot:6187942-Prymnesium_polylepis.1